MNNLNLSIIIPAYNEADRLPLYLDEWYRFLNERGLSYEIIVVDDGSTDETVACVKEHRGYGKRIRLLVGDHGGKGKAVKKGMLDASGQLRLFADADGATRAREIDRLFPFLEGKEEGVAIGSRVALAGDTTIERHLTRHYMGRVFATLTSLITGLSIYDTQCGFKLFTAKSAELLFSQLRTDGFAFDIELLLRAKKADIPVYEVPISWHDVPGSKVSVIRDAFRMVCDSIRIRRMLAQKQ